MEVMATDVPDDVDSARPSRSMAGRRRPWQTCRTA